MDNFHEPIPTEYDGVRFRSKGEAIFARALSLNQILWEYEPKRIVTLDNWTPDFLAVWRRKNKTLVICLIEYKPSTPTDSYFAVMKKRVVELGHSKPDCAFSHAVLAAGNSFSGGKAVFELNRKSIEWDRFERPWLFDYWDEASKYRFDLAGGGR